MPLDVDAVVVSNTHLSNDYNVLVLAAPAVASQVQPGQFVMVKPGVGDDPLLRRPFSVFEVLRRATGHRTLAAEQEGRGHHANAVRADTG